MHQRIDTRGVHPVYINGLAAIELRDEAKSLTIYEAVRRIEKLRAQEIKPRDEVAIEEEKRHLIECINWWGSYKKRNNTIDAENHILDKVGTISGVIRELSERLANLN